MLIKQPPQKKTKKKNKKKKRKNAKIINGFIYFKCVKFQKSHNLVIPCFWKHVKKLKCAYNACKCLRTYLEQFICAKPTYKGKGNYYIM